MEYERCDKSRSFDFLTVLILLLTLNSVFAINITVTGPDSAIFVSNNASFNCAFTTTYNVTQITWVRTFGDQNETIYSFSSGTGSSMGNASMRSGGELNADSHTLHVYDVTLYDSGIYYCHVEDSNNDTDIGFVMVDVYYFATDTLLTAVAFDANSSTCPPVASPYLSIAPFTTNIVCSLPFSKPASDYTLVVFDDVTNTTVNVTSVSMVNEMMPFGVTRDIVTVNLTLTNPGTYRVSCDQVYPFPQGVVAQTACLDIMVFESNSSKCVLLPCQNGGTCNTVGDTYNCTCTPWYTGMDCETRLPHPCDSDPCSNGGTCSGDPTSFNCSCSSCYSGDTCQNKTLTPCDPNPCNANLTCNDDLCPTYTCTCLVNNDVCLSVCGIKDPPPTAIALSYGESRNLSCMPPDVAGAAISWTKDGGAQQTVTILLIEDASAADAGLYTCTSVSSVCISTSATVVVTVGNDFEVLTSMNETLSLAIGTSQTLTCTVTGTPTPLVYWVFQSATPTDPPPPDNQQPPISMSNSTDETATVAPTTSAEVTTPAQTLTPTLTPKTAFTSEYVIPAVTASHEGTYICLASQAGVTVNDVVVRFVEISIATPSGNDTTCCDAKGGLSAWKIALIVLVVIAILVLVVVALIILMKKGKDGTGPFAGCCCFANAVHPDVKQVDETHNNNKGVGKNYQQYTKTYEDELEMEKKNAHEQHLKTRRKSNVEGRRLVRGDDTNSRSRSEDEDDERGYRNRRPRTPSPRSQGQIGSRTRSLPPLDLESERKRVRKKKRRNQEQEYGTDEEA